MNILYFLLALANAELISPTPSQSYLRGTIEPESNKSYFIDIIFIGVSFMVILLSNSLPPKKYKTPISILNI